MSKTTLTIKKPYLLFIGDVNDDTANKMARGIADFAAENVVGYNKTADNNFVIDGCHELSLEEAKKNGAKTLVLACVNLGGFIPDNWLSTIKKAIALGYDIANGMHIRLEDLAGIKEYAKKHKVNLIDVRHYFDKLPIGTGGKRAGKRILSIGSDCSVGKMYTALYVTEGLKKEGKKASFRATGQTGILIAGAGVPIDAVPADFISGATEMISPDNDPDHYDVIEGQGSLFHPSYAGVSLGLLHGSAADYLILCHEPTREYMRHLDGRYKIPDLQNVIDTNLQMAKLTNPKIKFIGVSINSSKLDENEWQEYKKNLQKKLNLPVIDPTKDGVAEIIKNII